MEKEKLIQKWLSNELSESESEAFKQLEEYQDYVRISETAKNFKAPVFNPEKTYPSLQQKLKNKKGEEKEKPWKSLFRIAAVFAVLVTAYFGFFHNPETEIHTIAGATEKIILPDNSLVQLNAESKITYSKGDWKDERILSLDGEAFFKVEKGAKFEVETSSGIVRVLGTQFNVKQRKNYFEVVCFEGTVEVETNETTLKLTRGMMFRVQDAQIQTGNIRESQPSWINGRSSFESVPFKEVIAELERQYAININIINTSILKDSFTGSFVHDDLAAALKSVSLPLGLDFTIKENVVILN